MIDEQEFGKLMAITEANAKAIEKNSQHITWLYRTIITIAIGVVITVAVKPFYDRAINPTTPESMINQDKTLCDKVYRL